jgi:hypothetical protein
MSAKYRKFPPTGTVTSVRIKKDLYAYVVIFHNCRFWLYGFLTKGRACDPALFPTYGEGGAAGADVVLRGGEVRSEK